MIGPSFHQKLKTTIAAVEGRPIGSGGFRLQTDLSGDSPSSGGSPMRLAAFTGTSVWVRMQPRQIYFVDTDTTDTVSILPLIISDRTATAIASMFSIPGVTTTVSMASAIVTVTRMNDRWHVIAASGGA